MWRILALELVGAAFCAAQQSAPAASPSSPTFNKDVLPIFQRRCQVCHRPGEIGTMPLLTYEASRPWAKAIKAAVMARKMPPWFADPKYGHFRDERILTQAEIHTISAWVDAGAPEGEAKEKPMPVPGPENWNIRADEIFQ